MISGFLDSIGARVRGRREAAGLSRRALAERSGISERFLAQLETGRGNISLLRFAQLAAALGTTPATLLERIDNGARPPLALLGVRGAGKSTVGRAVAERLEVPFVELDRRIEAAAGLTLVEIFELHGESYYRRVERQVLAEILAAGDAGVLATGGSIVSHPGNYALLASQARTVWLRARAEDHWERVIRQGDRRPMAKNPQAFAELEALLAAREPLYARADHVIDTSGAPIETVIDQVVAVLGKPGT
jgi:XRE family aerobic/anaerobic benzoate catabolism transcriptional regulator